MIEYIKYKYDGSEELIDFDRDAKAIFYKYVCNDQRNRYD